MPDDDAVEVQHVVQAIADYLARAPFAADSEQGIADWWLPQMGLDVPLATVQDALDLLVRRGVLTRTDLHNFSVIYRAGPAAPTR